MMMVVGAAMVEARWETLQKTHLATSLSPRERGVSVAVIG